MIQFTEYLLNISQKQIMPLKLLPPIILIILVISGVGYFLFIHQKDAGMTAQKSTVKPAFHFDSTNIKGWQSSQNAYPLESVTKDYTGDRTELPLVSMTIHRNDNAKTDNCFVSYSYYQSQPIDIAVKLKEENQQVTQKSSTLSLDETDIQTLPITTNQDKINVAIHRYNLSGSYPGEVMRGIELGYVNVKKGYIEIQGICAEFNQLDGTLAVFRAVTFDEADK